MKIAGFTIRNAERQWNLMGRPCGFDLTLFIQGQLFTQKEIIGGQGWAWTQTGLKVAHGIGDEREQYRCQLANAAKWT
jgi:hypothetical protein